MKSNETLNLKNHKATITEKGTNLAQNKGETENETYMPWKRLLSFTCIWLKVLEIKDCVGSALWLTAIEYFSM